MVYIKNKKLIHNQVVTLWTTLEPLELMKRYTVAGQLQEENLHSMLNIKILHSE